MAGPGAQPRGGTWWQDSVPLKLPPRPAQFMPVSYRAAHSALLTEHQLLSAMFQTPGTGDVHKYCVTEGLL